MNAWLSGPRCRQTLVSLLSHVSSRACADFPDAQRANIWVQHLSDRDDTADEALSEFTVRVAVARCPVRIAAMRRQPNARGANLNAC